MKNILLALTLCGAAGIGYAACLLLQTCLIQTRYRMLSCFRTLAAPVFTGSKSGCFVLYD